MVGTGQMIFAGVGMGAGVGMTGTGGGAPAGVLVVAGSYAIGVNGCVTAGHGASDLKHLLRNGNAPSVSSAPAPRKLLLKKAAEKPTQPAVAEPAPAAKPAQPTTPQQTTSTTVYKDSSGKTIKTVTKKGETITTTTPRGTGKPSATSADAAPVAKPRGGESPAAARGRQEHKEFEAKVEAKKAASKKEEKWESNPRIKDKATGKTYIPDATTPKGNPIELKPNTPSGRAAGRRQMKKYEEVTGKKGRVLYYDP